MKTENWKLKSVVKSVVFATQIKLKSLAKFPKFPKLPKEFKESKEFKEFSDNNP